MDTKEIQIGKTEIKVPDYYQKVDSMPEDPENSVPLMVKTDNAMCFAIAFPIAENEAMPFGAPKEVIDGIHKAMDDLQGLIEVESGEANGNAYIYSIVKSLREDQPGVQYTLTFEKQCNEETIHVQGYFDEVGTTGLRDTLVYGTFEPNVDFEQRMIDWRHDPYDSSYTRGNLMNHSEDRVYDDHFPGHPLSMCRELVKALCL